MVALLALLAGGLFLVVGPLLQDNPEISAFRPTDRDFLPEGSAGAIVHHQFYSLAYNEEKEHADWVAYRLSRERLQPPWVSRTDDFRPDPLVLTGSARPEDFRRSGYDRGHLVPAADMAFSEEAMSETFLMSNISPQEHTFNGGIWRELEELTRDWARDAGELYVVSAPVWEGTPRRIGRTGVAVPSAYLKVLLDLTEPELKGIAFVIPNQMSADPLYRYAVSIDSAEALTGLDFFPELLPDEVEGNIESRSNADQWPTDPNKFRIRVEQWNRR